jgi:hypothetical protein
MINKKRFKKEFEKKMILIYKIREKKRVDRTR